MGRPAVLVRVDLQMCPADAPAAAAVAMLPLPPQEAPTGRQAVQSTLPCASGALLMTGLRSPVK